MLQSPPDMETDRAKLLPRAQLIAFLSQIRDNGGDTYSFKLPMPEAKARNYVHRMRVELSRIRTRLRDQGKQIKPFKLLMHEWVPEHDGVNITLRYAETISPKFQREISSIFSVVTTGDDSIDDRAARGQK